MKEKPILEFDFLVALKEFMFKIQKEFQTEKNALVMVKRLYKKAKRYKELEEVEERLELIKGYLNQLTNYVPFLEDYLSKIK
jgi:menaquinone-dependent protoporphyrinogen IX oxidase